MNTARIACLGLASVLMLSCSSVAPVKVAVGDQCFRCRRTIFNERVAAETIATNGFVSKYRGPGCMAKYLVAHPDEKATIYVTDYTTGKMIPFDTAFYVKEVVDRNTGETDYRAYKEQAHANLAAAELHAQYVRWNDVLAEAH
jgi:copper chaperone NosL